MMPWNLFLAGAAGVGAVMVALWLVQRRTGNAGIVDAGWAGGLGSLALVYALGGPGDPTRRALVGLLGGLWGFRLAWHLLTDRVLGRPEEGRYRALRAEWGAAAQRNLLLFFEAQALLVAVLSWPFLLATSDPTPAWTATDGGGLALWLLGFALEATADRELRVFKADPANRGRTCQRGLWRLSRHPNYFGEWLMWCAFALLALSAPHGWTALAAPALLLFFILRVTGIPPTEAQALRSRGEEYRRYQQTTSAFFPWFPRRPGR
jgi:steroid 5-alpha reductase family enzyme